MLSQTVRTCIFAFLTPASFLLLELGARGWAVFALLWAAYGALVWAAAHRHKTDMRRLENDLATQGNPPEAGRD